MTVAATPATDGLDKLRLPLRPNTQRAETPAHVCSRCCQLTNIFGDVWQCSTTGTTHICTEACCTERVPYDNHSTMCRLSQRTFPNLGGSSRRQTSDSCLQAALLTRALSSDNLAEWLDLEGFGTLMPWPCANFSGQFSRANHRMACPQEIQASGDHSRAPCKASLCWTP